VKAAIDELVQQHGASPLPDILSDRLTRVFTLDLQRKLIESHTRVVFVAQLADVVRKEDHYIGLFEPTTESVQRIYFRLTVSDADVTRLMEQPRTFALNDFAVVGTIARVKNGSSPI
jgi:hypothetical protein